MLIMVLVLGASMLAVGAIVGYVTLQELRNAGDIANSTESIYAADAGIQKAFYTLFVTCSSTLQIQNCSAMNNLQAPSLSNGVTASVYVSGAYPSIDVKAMGHIGRVYRALEFSTVPTN